MQTQLPKSFTATAEGKKADDILRRCVHCGFCNNACPTYRQLGDETEGPRGRIYQMKRFLEGEKNGIENLLHLDHCLTCQSCESACPSGVEYRHLVDIVRPKMAAKIRRSFWGAVAASGGLSIITPPLIAKTTVVGGASVFPPVATKAARLNAAPAFAITAHIARATKNVLRDKSFCRTAVCKARRRRISTVIPKRC